MASEEISEAKTSYPFSNRGKASLPSPQPISRMKESLETEYFCKVFKTMGVGVSLDQE